jgi:universal stress protein A
VAPDDRAHELRQRLRRLQEFRLRGVKRPPHDGTRNARTAVMHILIPVDFSSASQAAAQYGFELAERMGARVTLLHVVASGIVSLPEATYVPTEEERKAVAEEARAELRALAFRFLRAGVPVDCVASEGAPAQAIVDWARDHRVDLIVAGTHGRRGLAHVILGSVAEMLVRTAACPVLTVGRAATQRPHAA